MRLAQILLNNCVKESNAAAKKVTASTEADTVAIKQDCVNKDKNSTTNEHVVEAEEVGFAIDNILPEQVNNSDDEDDGDGGEY